MHAFQGRTVDTVIAAMEAEHPHLTTQKSFYVEISRARHRAELVTDDRQGAGRAPGAGHGRAGRGARKPRTGARGGEIAAQAPVPEQPDGADKGVERAPGPSWEMPMEWTGPDLEL